MNIIGISAYYHESACCLLKDGRLVAAASEERFTRVKQDSRLPVRAFRYCLHAGQISPAEIDCVAYYETPTKKLARQIWSGLPSDPEAWLYLDPQRPENTIRENLGYDGRIETFEHHHSHAASAFFYSPFKEAAVFTADGVGEWATTTYGRARQAELDIFEEVKYPHSLGLFYASLTAYLGFRVNRDEYKVMGLAAYGNKRFAKQMYRLIASGPSGQFHLNMDFFDFVGGQRMYSDRLCELFGQPARKPEEELTPFHQDIAHSLQYVLEEVLLEKMGYLAKRVGSPNLCMAGGVALNSVANGRIRRESPFENIFIQPAAGDAGGCLGAAALAHAKLSGARSASYPLAHVYLGPAASEDEILAILAATGIQAQDFRGQEGGLYAEVVDRLVKNKVVGWFQGAMEFGPRALGSRSILANPMDPDVRDRLNRAIKKREDFRPFAPSVLQEFAYKHFDLKAPSPYMLETCQVTSALALPGITHVDGSARPQTVEPKTNPRFAALLDGFYKRTGCPILLNTSLNTRGEPIVRSVVDALICMHKANLDCLVLEDFLIDREMLPPSWDGLLEEWDNRPHDLLQRGEPHGMDLYTFV